MHVAEKYGKSAIKSADNIISDVGSKAIKAMETGGDIGKQAPRWSIYVELDVPSNTVFLGEKDDWGIIAGPDSLYDRLNVKKGVDLIEMAKNEKEVLISLEIW